jgi:ABC-type cobalt transport system substrate-binding protein
LNEAADYQKKGGKCFWVFILVIIIICLAVIFTVLYMTGVFGGSDDGGNTPVSPSTVNNAFLNY